MRIEPAETNSPEVSMWCAVYTRHQHEKSVAENFSRSGFEVFLPVYRVMRRWKDRKKYLSLPLFPCYVFVRYQPGGRLQILTTPGVHFIVRDAGRPARICDTEIEMIRRAVDSGRNVEPHPFLRFGELLRVKTGPLAGIEGILIRKKSSFRLVVSAEILKKSISVELDASSVEPLPHQPLTSSLLFARNQWLVSRNSAGCQSGEQCSLG